MNDETALWLLTTFGQQAVEQVAKASNSAPADIERAHEEQLKGWTNSMADDFPGGMPEYGSTTLEDDVEYQGTLANGKPHGHGVQKWKTGRIFVGQFRSGKAKGPGKRIYPGGFELSGVW